MVCVHRRLRSRTSNDVYYELGMRDLLNRCVPAGKQSQSYWRGCDESYGFEIARILSGEGR